MTLSRTDKCKLLFQQVTSWLFFPLLYGVLILWMRCYKGYRIKQLKQVRQQYREIVAACDGPLMICPNHLTFIDSLILAWAFRPAVRYFFSFKTFPWNLPKRSHVDSLWRYKLICYLGKCLLISPNSRDALRTMKLTEHLLHHNHHVMIFPEGTRSKTGRINTETFVYGVGGLIHQAKKISVLSVYLRGDNQLSRSEMPCEGEQFTILMRVIQPYSSLAGRRAQREVATQLIDNLVELEGEYFDNARQ